MTPEKNKVNTETKVNLGQEYETNGNEHNLIPDEKEWMDYAKDEMEDFIESQGIYIRQ